MRLLETISRRMQFARATARTRIVRTVRGATTVEESLRARIADRIRGLGAIYEDGNSDLVGVAYHPIYFPGYERVLSHRDGCDVRLRAIAEDLRPRPGDWILDVGANVGYFSFGLAELGARVEAYEIESGSFEIGAALSRLHDRDVIYINKAMSLRTLGFLRPHYRAVLLLSVLHWIVKQEGDQAAIAILRDLASRADRLYFEAPVTSASAKFDHDWFLSNESVGEFLAWALPDYEVTPLLTDSEWMNRMLWRITPGRGQG